MVKSDTEGLQFLSDSTTERWARTRPIFARGLLERYFLNKQSFMRIAWMGGRARGKPSAASNLLIDLFRSASAIRYIPIFSIVLFFHPSVSSLHRRKRYFVRGPFNRARFHARFPCRCRNRGLLRDREEPRRGKNASARAGVRKIGRNEGERDRSEGKNNGTRVESGRQA